MSIFVVCVLIAGLGIVVFHSLLLFKKGFVDMLQKSMWKPKHGPPEEWHYIYNKYIGGIEGLIIGIMLIGFAILYFLR